MCGEAVDFRVAGTLRLLVGARQHTVCNTSGDVTQSFRRGESCVLFLGKEPYRNSYNFNSHTLMNESLEDVLHLGTLNS